MTIPEIIVLIFIGISLSILFLCICLYLSFKEISNIEKDFDRHDKEFDDWCKELDELFINKQKMTQEDKELLIKDLCAKLPYGVKFAHKNGFDTLEGIVDDFINPTNEHSYNIEDIKPYLFPMSSMTEEQEKEYYDTTYSNHIPTIDSFDWLNAHHFDYRGLIEKGLAIDATDLGIYGSDR